MVICQALCHLILTYTHYICHSLCYMIYMAQKAVSIYPVKAMKSQSVRPGASSASALSPSSTNIRSHRGAHHQPSFFPSLTIYNTPQQKLVKKPEGLLNTLQLMGR